MKKFILLLHISVFLSCSQNEKQPTSLESKADTVSPEKITSATAELQNLQELNNEILQILKAKKFTELAKFIHPEKGVRFSMYGYIDTATDKLFTREDFIRYIDTDVKFTFGHKDGTGEIYQTSLKNYLTEWVYQRDFLEASYLENEIKGKGNTLNNLREVFPDAAFTENYIVGSEEYAYMDWSALRFVFEKSDGKYYLIAVINDQWTV